MNDKKVKQQNRNRLNLFIKFNFCMFYIGITGIIFTTKYLLYIIIPITTVLLLVFSMWLDRKYYNKWSERNFRANVVLIVIIALGTLTVLVTKLISIIK